jgi:4-azaleucine resistance transporter AzlC
MKMKALKAAFPYTVPILLGFLFLGVAYGIYMDSKGFSFLYPMLMSLTVFAGSMQFVAANLLLGPFSPLTVFLITMMVNARHLFYGISMLEKYKSTGIKKWYLIFAMCDESFSINVSIEPPPGVDRGWFMLFVNLLNHGYWVLGSTLGGLLGSLVSFNTEGLDFVMTALFIVIFLDQWLKTKNHIPALIGIAASVLSLLLFRSSGFILPAMALIVICLTVLKGNIEKKEAAVK